MTPREGTVVDEDFVAQRAPAVASVEIDGQVAIAASMGGQAYTHWLDPVGTLIWNCLDGASPLREVIDDAAAAFGVDREVVRAPVIELTRELGRAGLLAGVPGEPLVIDLTAEVTGLPAGTPIGPWESTDVDGRRLTHADIGPAFVVNWSPACEFCAGIAVDLASMRPDALAHGYEIVLLAHGSIEANRGLAEAAGFGGPIVVPPDLAAFSGLGTPAAYRVDGEGRISSYLALGADMVVALVRTAMSSQ